jgi:hypothetical protein
MSACDSLVVLGIGLPLSLLGFHLNHTIQRSNASKEEPERDINQPIEAHLKLEYETLNEEVRRRSEVVIGIAGTIFVITSFVLLGQSAISTDATIKMNMAVAALLVYAFYLYAFAYTSAWLDAITFQRLHELEKDMGIIAHRQIAWIISQKFPKWIWLRRASWSILLLLETLVAAYIVH